MDDFHVYKGYRGEDGRRDLCGVVGPVRTGKSTFIKRFMELLVLPNLPDGQKKSQTRDELPQSAAGKTIMTTEPKFIEGGGELELAEGSGRRCGSSTAWDLWWKGAAEHTENGEERLVKTPWVRLRDPFAGGGDQDER